MSRILIIEDNQTMREGMTQILSKEGYEVDSAVNGKEGVLKFISTQPDFVITDIKMDEMDGISVLEEIQRKNPETLVMLITAFGTIELAVDAMRKGAHDFITKPFPPELLRLKVKSALRLSKVNKENRFFRKETSKPYNEFVGNSKVMQDLKSKITQIAQTDSTVLISGESGTGKELVARAIHAESDRKNKAFIKTDCSALAEGLLESELFGHEKGSFTGAISRKTGRFELAEGGTLFLDEIGEISANLQLKLLRVLQDRVIERVGGTQALNVDVRIISATNKDLKEEVQQGRFREDLYYRLYVVPLDLKPLRERKEDIIPLVEYFQQKWQKISGKSVHINNAALKKMTEYDWPGNIRELQNMVERVLVLCKNEEVREGDLPREILGNKEGDQEKSNDFKVLSLNKALAELEKKMIQNALADCKGIKAKAAKKLGVKTTALYYKMEKYGLMNE